MLAYSCLDLCSLVGILLGFEFADSVGTSGTPGVVVGLELWTGFLVVLLWVWDFLDCFG